MTQLRYPETRLRRCRELADVLIPGNDTMPAVVQLADFDGLLLTAFAACGHDDEEIERAIDALPDSISWESVVSHATVRPADFRVVAQLVSAAYYMASEVLAALGYPTERRAPAPDDAFADEYLTGVLDPVLERGTRYIDTRTHRQGDPRAQ